MEKISGGGHLGLYLKVEDLAVGCLIAQGCADKEIGRVLGKGREGARSRVRRLLASAGLRSRSELAAATEHFMLQAGFKNDLNWCKIAPICPARGYCKAK